MHAACVHARAHDVQCMHGLCGIHTVSMRNCEHVTFACRDKQVVDAESRRPLQHVCDRVRSLQIRTSCTHADMMACWQLRIQTAACLQSVTMINKARTSQKCCIFDARSKRKNARVHTSHDTYLHGFFRDSASVMRLQQHAQFARRCNRLSALALCE